jgi:hypothetical protein
VKKSILIMTLLAGLLSSTSASAQDGKKPGEIESYDLGEERIEGKIRKPEVFYILARERFTYEDLSLKQSFVDLILRDARVNPF